MSKTVAALLILCVVVAAWMLVGHCSGWNKQQRLETQPRVLEQTKEAKKAERVSLTEAEALELCSGLRPIAQTVKGSLPLAKSPKGDRGKGKASVENSFGLRIQDNLREAQLLDVLKVGPLPSGGEVSVTLTPGDAAPVLVVTPNPRPWIEGMSRWRISALVGYGGGSDGEMGAAAAASLEWTALRTGRIDYGLAATGFHAPVCSGVIGGVRLGFE